MTHAHPRGLDQACGPFAVRVRQRGECYVSAMTMVLLARFASLPEAHVAKALLASEGVDVLMPEQGLAAGELDMGVLGGWRLLVHEDDVEAARRILLAAGRPAEGTF